MTALDATYSALAAVVGGLDDGDAWAPTGCSGWCVRDLVHHLRADAVRALVALHTPAVGGVDCDSVDYWRRWGVDPERDELNRRATRVEAGLRSWAELRDAYVEAAGAVRRGAAAARQDTVVATQGHALTVADLASTLVVEATLHHLDLVACLGAPGPAAEGLTEVRRVVEAVLGRHLHAWPDERVALVTTGRATPVEAETAALAGAAVPVFT